MTDRINLTRALDYAEACMLRGERPRVDLTEVVAVLRKSAAKEVPVSDVGQHPLDRATKDLSAWAYTDSLVQLDAVRLRQCLADDAAQNARAMLTPDECEVFICGGEDGGIPPELVAAFPKTHAYLEEFWS